MIHDRAPGGFLKAPYQLSGMRWRARRKIILSAGSRRASASEDLPCNTISVSGLPFGLKLLNFK
jgi:hypothetical protein